MVNMPYNKMTLEQLIAEREKLVQQRLLRLRGSNPYKRLTAKITQIDKVISNLRKQEKRKVNEKIQARTRSMVGRTW
jgi:hypothetical protein